MLVHDEPYLISRDSETCNQCNKVFVFNSGLRTHIRTVHEITQEFPCDQCNKVFRFDGDLRVHISTVHMPSHS